MNIVVTALGESMDSPVDQRFGRARYFISYDSDAGTWAAHSNEQNLSAAQGAGIQAGQAAAELGANVVITGHCGPKAFATLKAAEIDVYAGASGTVKEALDAFSRGELTAIGNADVEGHFGSV